MALFGGKKKEAVTKAPKAKVVSVASVSKTTGQAPAMPHAGQVILAPRITEKATVKADAENVYVFEIANTANKTTVRQAIKSMYNVVPTRVNITRNPGKKHMSRGKMGFTQGVKKAYVYVKAGEKIEFV